MKKRHLLGAVLVLLIIITAASCESLLAVVIKPKAATSAGSGSGSKGSGDPYFKSNEVLVKIGTVDDYFLATVLTPAVDGKDAEVLILVDNTKMWVSSDWIMPSHIPSDGELNVGDPIMAAWFSGDKHMGEEDYRRSGWTVYTVTSVDDLYKGEITAGGAGNVKIDMIRLPEKNPVEMK